ncbi:MAG: helicase-related protein, partial [bacterium]|nr:helicase-related protein [bacterium]
GLQKPIHIQKSFVRKNLKITVHQCFNEHDKLLHLLYLLQKHHDQTGIIYVLTRKDAHAYAQLLNRLRPGEAEIAVYHGGLDKEIRQRIQKGFIDESIKIIIATNAFGLGIDQPHVRFVIHAQISSNLENYFQEIGRAGRDGNLSDCYTLFTKKDLEISAQFIAGNSSADKTQLKILRFKLQQIIKYLETKQCRQKFILNYFDEKTPLDFACQLCDHCRHMELAYSDKVKTKFAHWQTWRNNYARTKNLISSSVITNLSLAYLSIVDWRQFKDLALIPGIGAGAKKILTRFLETNQDLADLTHLNL